MYIYVYKFLMINDCNNSDEILNKIIKYIYMSIE